MYCEYCKKEFRFESRLSRHKNSCNLRPNKPVRKSGNQYTKAIELGLPKPVAKFYVWSDEDKKEQSKRSAKINKEYWTAENKEKHSQKMKSVVLDNIESYTKNNVSGRVKNYEVIDSIGKTKVKGKWELKVAEWLNLHNVRWTNDVNSFEYLWNDKIHRYFPDFYLIEYDIYIEVKGYKTDRDNCKWNNFPKRLIIVDSTGINNLDTILKEFDRGVEKSGISSVS